MRSALQGVSVWGSPEQIAHAKQQQATIERLTAALTEIAQGTVPPEKEGHYLAHRRAVRLAREAITKAVGQ
jgi:hypothetical protein